jgi:hypothetical protein
MASKGPVVRHVTICPICGNPVGREAEDSANVSLSYNNGYVAMYIAHVHCLDRFFGRAAGSKGN